MLIHWAAQSAAQLEDTFTPPRARQLLDNTTASDLLAADGIILGTPANIGYMSGALKHFFDQVFYVCAADTRGLPSLPTSTATLASKAPSARSVRSPTHSAGPR